MTDRRERKSAPTELPPIDSDFLHKQLLRLLAQHSPTGYTDPVVRMVCATLDDLGIEYDVTRRGAIRARLRGASSNPSRAIVAHVDTLGAMVKELKPNGRLAIVPIGTWSSRFAEGSRVSIFTDREMFRGTILPLKASGHTYHRAVDSQPVSWSQVEVRVDEDVSSRADLEGLGFNVGDFIGVDAHPEVLPNGYINARHLDDKAGVAALLAAAKALVDAKVALPIECYLLFTISEETGSGASAVLHGDASEMVTVDNGTVAPGQSSREFGVTIAMADSSGPFDYHLTHHLLSLCRRLQIPHQRDIFRHYRCDSASAVEAGNDIRTAVITFGVDASHGYERTHFHALESVAALLVAYALQRPLFAGHSELLSDLEGFPGTTPARIHESEAPHPHPADDDHLIDPAPGDDPGDDDLEQATAKTKS